MSTAEADYVAQSDDAKDTLLPITITLAEGVRITISYNFFRGCRSTVSATYSQQVDGRQAAPRGAKGVEETQKFKFIS